MTIIYFDNNRAIKTELSVDDWMKGLKGMRENDKKFLRDNDGTSIINIDKIVYIQEEEDE